MGYIREVVINFYKEHGINLVPEYKFLPDRKFKFDFAIPELMIALEVEGGIWTGGRHTRPVGFKKDMEKYNLAASNGWLVLRTTPGEVCMEDTLEIVKKTINTRKRIL